jgi:perosamine synthetase
VITESDAIAATLAALWPRLESPLPAESLMDFAKLAFMAIFIQPRLYWIPNALPFLRLGQTIFPKRVAVKRLSGMQAGLLHDFQHRLSQSNQRRSETAASVSRQMSLSLPQGPSHPYLRVPVLAETPQGRERIHSFAQRRGLGVSRAYPTPINAIPEISHLFDGRRFPTAQRVSEHIFTIPTHQWLSEKDQRAIAECAAPSTAVRPVSPLARRATSLQ